MNITLETFLQQVKAGYPVSFQDTQHIIKCHYEYHPVRFYNGSGPDRLVNQAGSNEGSCRIFYFAKLHNLSVTETLNLYGDYYRDEVLPCPEGSNHPNIRQFIRYGWEGIEYEENEHPCLVKREKTLNLDQN